LQGWASQEIGDEDEKFELPGIEVKWTMYVLEDNL
jgi:hypothetical protein